jgi:hypothetical protein
MPAPRCSRAQCEQVVGALNAAIKAGYRIGGYPSAYEAAAKAIDIPVYTIRDRLESAKRWYGLVPIDNLPEHAPIPVIEPISKPRVIVRASSAARPDGDPIRLTVIGDCHIAPGQDLSRFSWFARHVAATKPDRVIQIGDLADLHSVSGHEKPGSAQQKAKPAFQQDMEATEEALALYRKEMPDGPPLHITEGNHEDRLDRWDSQVAETSGVLRNQWNDLMARYNVRQTPYRGYLFIGSVGFTHIPMTLMERPYNGKTLNPLANDLTMSCVMGHSHRHAFLNVGKIGPQQRIEILNVGCAAPHGWFPDYNVSEQGGYSWGIVDLTIHGGHIVGHTFIDMLTLESRYA